MKIRRALALFGFWSLSLFVMNTSLAQAAQQPQPIGPPVPNEMVQPALLQAPAQATTTNQSPRSTVAEDPFNSRDALRYSQGAIGGTVGNYAFQDQNGRAVRLADFLGKPLVVSLVYTSCYQICSMTTRNLARVVKIAQEALGTDGFTVLTIGFDTRFDNPAAMHSFAKQQGVDLPNWHFLSTDSATITALSKDLGFIFRPSPKGFDHLVQATVIDAGGKVYRQVYGELFETQQLVEPLKQLVFGIRSEHSAVDNLVNRVRLFCTTYDPATDSYRFDYSLFIGIFIGATIIGGAFAYLIHEWRRSNRLSRA